eukprot:11167268-Lingulodinium_polyedra.AAC.1
MSSCRCPWPLASRFVLAMPRRRRRGAGFTLRSLRHLPPPRRAPLFRRALPRFARQVNRDGGHRRAPGPTAEG